MAGISDRVGAADSIRSAAITIDRPATAEVSDAAATTPATDERFWTLALGGGGALFGAAVGANVAELAGATMGGTSLFTKVVCAAFGALLVGCIGVMYGQGIDNQQPQQH